MKEKYHRFLHGGTTKNGILGNQLHFTHSKRTTFRDDFEGFNRNLRIQSLPAMNGVPGVSNFSFTLFQSPGEKQANIRITSREVRIVVYHETDVCFQKVSLHVIVCNISRSCSLR